MTEKQFQATVVELARLAGWLCFHPFDSRRSTPGFPDLTLVRGGRIVFAELKVPPRTTTAAQDRWLAALQAVAAAEVHVWKPGDWDSIQQTLLGGRMGHGTY